MKELLIPTRQQTESNDIYGNRLKIKDYLASDKLFIAHQLSTTNLPKLYELKFKFYCFQMYSNKKII